MLVDGASQPVRLPSDFDDDFVELPLVTDARQPPADRVRESLAELERPLPHRLVADDDEAAGISFDGIVTGTREMRKGSLGR